MRKKIVAGNWKMNNNFDQGLKLATEVTQIVKDEVNSEVTVVLCAPYVHLSALSKIVSGKVKLGAQNCHQKKSGAFTGEISAEMLKSIGVEYVILGHSERREYFKESDELLASKVDVALEHGLTPIFCIGETLKEREAGIHFNVIHEQLEKGLFHLNAENFSKIVLAYEPVWAIGTGVTATTDQAQEVHADIRSFLEKKYGKEVAENTTIQYGGSCNPSNAPDLFSCADIDGGLIGGASLEARKFVDVVKAMK
ncbi:MAG: triose-phosphate isomerase [Cytophagales bacterium]